MTIQRLTDIRDAQVAYKEVNGEFTDSFDTLLGFHRRPLVPLNFSIGSFHDTLPEAMCLRGGLSSIKRADVPGLPQSWVGTEQACSTALPLMQWLTKCVTPCTLPSLPRILRRRSEADKKLPHVNLDSLTFSPTSGERFLIDTTYVNQSGLRVSAIKVQDPRHLDANVKKDTLRFGSLDEAHTDGNWRQ